MIAKSSAPGAATAPERDESTGSTATVTPLPTAIPAEIRVRLHREGINSCEDWRRLGAKRGQLFGITKKTRKAIDAAVRGGAWRKP